MRRLLFLQVLFLFETLQGSPINYETYLESWDPQWQNAMEDLPPGPGGSSGTSYSGVTLQIAFASYDFSIPGIVSGLQFSGGDSDIDTVINFVRGHGGKVKLSFGGASYAGPYYFISSTPDWPNNIGSLSDGVAAVIAHYGFDGVDFDIEDSVPLNQIDIFAQNVFDFLQLVRAKVPIGTSVSLTLAAQGWGSYGKPLSQKVAAVSGLVDYINFMEYDIWVNSNLPGGYAQQIAADIATYTASPDQSPAPNNSPGWGIPKNLIQIGLMPGEDDSHPPNIMTPDAAQNLAQLAIDQDLYGVMTWDINRDAGTNPSPPVNEPPYTYAVDIRQVLGQAQKSQKYKQHRIHTNRKAPSQNEFVQQPPPPHGSP